MSVLPIQVPAGVADDSTRALAQLIDERFRGIGVERVLVWHLDSTVASALPHIAEMLGLDGPEFQGSTPRELLRSGIALRRRRGTAWALREVLRRLGYGEVELTESATLRYDGAVAYDGARRYGADSHPAVFWIAVDIAESKSAARVRALWDVVDAWRRRSTPFLLALRRASDHVEVAQFWSRAECADVEI